MRTNLAYIDDVMEKEIDRRHKGAETFTEDDHKNARDAGTRSISGFPVFDEAKEKKYLNDLIAQRRKLIDGFITDRKNLRQMLSSRGITPLAVLPKDAWNAICDQTELFRLSPSPTGGISTPSKYAMNWVVETSKTKRNMFGGKFTAKSYDLREGAAEDINAFARSDWKGFLKAMFDGLEAKSGSDVNLILPTPPEDVAKILLKAEGLDLKVAAEADAIVFDKAPSEIVKNLVDKMEAEARLKELRDADPIVYTEEGTATAIIAQFGDFPIEKMVVDAVITNGDLIKEKPTTIDYARYNTFSQPGGLYQLTPEQMEMVRLQQQMMQQAMYQPSPLLGNSIFTTTNTLGGLR